jgi:tRNA nucleotidyltransferase (CCA-adding enzyme)
LKDLAVNGRDLIELGIAPGPQLGETLQMLLEKVIDGEVQNERDALIDILK